MAVVTTPIPNEQDTPLEKPLCFVIGPIGEKGGDPHRDAEFLLEMVIRPALEADYTVKRADEDTDPGMINNTMILDITHAALVVADLTSLNPNALYELGIRHSTEKPVIHVATAGTKLPFDTHGHRTIFFDLRDFRSINATKAALVEAAARTREPGYQVSNPITQANASFRMPESSDPAERVLADLQARVEIIESELRVVGQLASSDETFAELERAAEVASARAPNPAKQKEQILERYSRMYRGLASSR